MGVDSAAFSGFLARLAGPRVVLALISANCQGDAPERRTNPVNPSTVAGVKAVVATRLYGPVYSRADVRIISRAARYPRARGVGDRREQVIGIGLGGHNGCAQCGDHGETANGGNIFQADHCSFRPTMLIGKPVADANAPHLGILSIGISALRLCSRKGSFAPNVWAIVLRLASYRPFQGA